MASGPGSGAAGAGKSIATERPKESRKTFLRLMSYLVRFKVQLALICLLVVISVGASLTGSYLLRPIINDYIIPGDLPGLWGMLLILLGIYLAGVAATFVQYRLLNSIGQRTAARLRRELFGKMEKLPIQYFDTHQHGDLMSRYTNDMDRVSEVLTDNLADIITAVLSLTGILCLMLFVSPLLTLATLIVVPIMMLFANTIAKRSRKYFSAQQGILGEVNGYIEEMISGQKVVKVFGHEEEVDKDFEVLNQDFVRYARSKGLRERAVLWGHAFKNAMIPVVTILGGEIGALLGGSVVTESIFSWPGVGRLALNSIYKRDYPMIQGVTLIVCATFLIINLLVDIVYALMDPRIRLDTK